MTYGHSLCFRFERTYNYALVKEVMTHPKIWPWISDDCYPPRDDFQPHEGEAIHYMMALCQASRFWGLCITHPITGVLWEIHHALLPCALGYPAYRIGRDFEAWMWDNTDAQTLVGLTPGDNPLALRFARRQGGAECGRIPSAIRRGGKLHDMTLFCKCRP